MEISKNQEAFNKSAKYLMAAKKRCGIMYENGFQCLYENKGSRCGVGCLLTEEEINTLKKNGLNNLKLLNIPANVNLPSIAEVSEGLLLDLQNAHDKLNNWIDKKHMKSFLLNVAKTYGLNTDVLSEF